jgi:acetyltransferase
VDISRLSAPQALDQLPGLAALLQDAVASGASVGFLPPLVDQEALAYWQDVIAALAGPHRLLLVAQVEGALAGTVQLLLASTPNGRHRAEVAKMMVHTRYRRQGIGRALMLAVEAEARHAGRSTLVLDTRQGEPSEQLYLSVGYARAGAIPDYARSADGTLHTTVIMYKLLK